MYTEKSSLAEHLSSSAFVLALLGAGLSAPSGIPTVRGPSSSGHDATWFATRAAFAHEPALVQQYFSDRRRLTRNAVPNAAHYALAQLAHKQSHFLAVSQNVDGKVSHAKLVGEIEVADNIRSLPKGRALSTTIG